ncbi:MAG: ABC transporter substrate-binding protein [Usitatibacter sp.]
MQIKSLIVGLAVMAAVVHPAAAQSITVGVKADPTVDPHFLYLAPNIAFARHMFDRLVDTDAKSQPVPGLAVSWKALDEKTWEFKLRPGVKFHDGSPFTAEDVLFSIERVKTLPNNPNPYMAGLRTVKDISTPDPMTVRFTTEVPNPEFPMQLRIISIVSKKIGAASPSDFVSGKATIGTGAYSFVSFAPGDRLILKRNEGYWGKKPAYENVTFRIMTNDASRVAALLSGDVDAIDNVPPTDVPRLKNSKDVKLFTSPSDRIIYLALNSTPDKLTGATDRSGAPLDKNPMRDERVRLAISKAMDRKALVSRGLEGLGVPAGQLVPEGFPGYSATIKAEGPDVAGAKKLLAQAGYADKLSLDLLCPNGRYVNDAAVCQMVGAMLTRIGIKPQVEALPPTVFFPKIKVPTQQASIMLIGWGLGSGSGLSMLTDVLRTYDKDAGAGANNRGASDRELDKLIDAAAKTFDNTERVKMMESALLLAKKNTVAVPLYAEMVVMAARKGITLVPRYDQQTVIVPAYPAK